MLLSTESIENLQRKRAATGNSEKCLGDSSRSGVSDGYPEAFRTVEKVSLAEIWLRDTLLWHWRGACKAWMDTLPAPLTAGCEEVFKVLVQEPSPSGQVPWDQPARGTPILNRSDADSKNAGNVAIAVHGLERKVLDGKDSL